MAEYEKFKNKMDRMMSDDKDELLGFSATLSVEGFGKVKMNLTKHMPFADGMLKEYRLAISALNKDLNMSLWFDAYSSFYNEDTGHDNILFIFMYRGKVSGTLSIHEYDNFTIETVNYDTGTVKE